ncbi:hypothetical protein VP01_656g6 [Puccinia sorghi]|uniref:Uncharacterized protein n=1 Tax=Puccinia sorghi TaxID=27349 RepID=A0A0L6UFA7_9BASI|nr:hypothetical protein VP01_656g6 [Puccinia sorghi]
MKHKCPTINPSYQNHVTNIQTLDANITGGNQGSTPKHVSSTQMYLGVDTLQGNDIYSVCQVTPKRITCGLKIKKDQSGSTKIFHDHLQKVLRLVDPKAKRKIH